MNIRQLEAFRAVMVAGSMVGAAEMLHISQPAVSQIIRQFELRSGVRLFERRNGRIFPTPEAAVLFAEVERLFVDVGKVARLAHGLRDNQWGTLRISAFPAVIRRLLPKILAEYSRQKPEVGITLDSTQSRNMADLVARKEVDLALSVLPSDRDDVEAEQILALRAVCVLPRRHRLAARAVIAAGDLEGEPFISLGRSDRSRFAVDKVFEALGINRRQQIEATQSEAACAFVAEGCGVSVVDPISVFDHRDTRTVVLPFEPVVLFKLWLLQPPASARLRLAQDFAHFLKDRMTVLLAPHQVPDD
ncbi:MAG: LysR substrate-binding domain-containing protein [Parvibaculaceae bacterium]